MQLLEGVYAPHQHKRLKDILFLVIGILLFSVYAGLLVPYNGIEGEVISLETFLTISRFGIISELLLAIDVHRAI